MRKLSWLLLPVLLSSCVDLFGPPTEQITINTANGKPATCLLKNNLGMWKTNTAQLVEIKKSSSVLKISCTAKKLVAYKNVNIDTPSSKYPQTVTVTMHVKKHNETTQYNDDSSEQTQNNDDSDSAAESKPLNILPEENDDADTVEIIRH